ncbi:MAG: hypothetical protein ACOC56_04690 [Atribacterota bacterium]
MDVKKIKKQISKDFDEWFRTEILDNLSHGESYERGVTFLEYKGKDMSHPEYLCRNDSGKEWDELEPGGVLLKNDIKAFIFDKIEEITKRKLK